MSRGGRPRNFRRKLSTQLATKRKETQTLTEILIASRPNASIFVDHATCERILVQAGDLLMGLHDTIGKIQEQTENAVPIVYESTIFTAVFGLLDLLLLEGVYPSMSFGTYDRLRLQSKSVLFPRGVPYSAEPPNLNLIQRFVWSLLNNIVLDRGIGVQPLFRRRLLSDLVAANGDLAFTQTRNEKTRRMGKSEFGRLLAGYVPSSLDRGRQSSCSDLNAIASQCLRSIQSLCN